MKKPFIIIYFFWTKSNYKKSRSKNNSNSDCNQTGLVVNVGSYPNMVSLYHSGNYLTYTQSSNVIVWKITDTQDNLIAQDTIVGESLFSFGHDLSLTDTINVSAH